MASCINAKQRLHDSIHQAENLIARCKNHSEIKGIKKLARKLQSELKFLNKLSEKDDRSIEMQLNSTNLVHLQAVVDAMETLPNVVCVMKSVRDRSGNGSVVHVDVVCNNGYTWTKVVARKPRALHLIWAGGGQFGDRSIEEQGRQYIKTAKENPKHFVTPQVVFIFVQGITVQLKQAMESTGVIVQGDIEEIDSQLELHLQQLKNNYDNELTADKDLINSDLNDKLVDKYPLFSNDYDGDFEEEEELLSATELMNRKKKQTESSSNEKKEALKSESCCSDVKDIVISGVSSSRIDDNLAADTYTGENIYAGYDTLLSECHGKTLETLGSNDAISVLSERVSCNVSINRDRLFGGDCSCNSQRYSQEQQYQACSLTSNALMQTDNLFVCDKRDEQKEALLKDRCCKCNDKSGKEIKSFSDLVDCRSLCSNSFDNVSTVASQISVIDANEDLQSVGACFSVHSSATASHREQIKLLDKEFKGTTKVLKKDLSQGNSNKCNNMQHGDNSNVQVVDNMHYTNDKFADRVNDNLSGVSKLNIITTTSTATTTQSFNKNSDVASIRSDSSTTTSLFSGQPVINKLNLDITTLISYVSNVCHGSCNFVFQEPILTQQAAEERKKKLLPDLEQLFEGKELFTCETALTDFQSILTTVGGPDEKERAETLLRCITVIPDCPSQRISQLEPSAKIKERAKVIFGTGDSLKAMTVTANIGFVRSAEQRGIDLAVFVHPSRALSQQKEATAKPI